MKHIALITLLSAPFIMTSCVIGPCGPLDSCGSPAQSQDAFMAPVDSGANDARLPDPRYRQPFGVWEIDRVASMVAKATGQRTAGSITVTDQVAVAGIGGPLDEGELRINPTAAATIPPNSWAFIIGHEFAHRTHGLSSPNGTDPAMEAEADAIGARYAMAAGFDLAAHIDWTLSHVRDGWSPSHGSTHDRAYRLAARYGLAGNSMW
jgi:hypothetical protein